MIKWEKMFFQKMGLSKCIIMNILFILTQIQKGGGQVIQALNLAKFLIKNKNQVKILTFKINKTSEDVKEIAKELEIYYFPFSMNYLRLLIAPFLINKIMDLIKTWKIDIIQTFDPHLSTLIGVLLGKKIGKPVICRIGARYRSFYEDKLLKGGFFEKLLYYIKMPSMLLILLEYYAIRRTSFVISNSSYILKTIVQSPVLNLKDFNWKIIHNGVDLEKFHPNLDVQNQNLEKYSNKKIILYLGRIQDYKGIHVLIKAVAIIRELIPTIHLIIIGSPQFNFKYYNKLRNFIGKLKIDDIITFIDGISHKIIPEYLNLADILVLPSYSSKSPINEGLPNVILEGMATECLVAATSVGGIPEIIENEKNGLLFQPNQHKKLANLLITVFNNPLKYRKISANARAFVVKNHAFENIAQKYLEVYELSLKSGV